MKYGAPSREKTDQAIELIVGTALSLIKEGKIANPLETAAQQPEAASVAPGGGGEGSASAAVPGAAQFYTVGGAVKTSKDS